MTPTVTAIPTDPKASFSGEPRNFEEFVRESARVYSTKNAFSLFDGEVWQQLSYTDLQLHVYSLASQLETAGLKPGQRIALIAEPSILWVTHFFAILLCGAIAVPLDHKLTESELFNILKHCEPSLILCSKSFREMATQLRMRLTPMVKMLTLEEWESGQPLLSRVFVPKSASRDELAVICYTSGTSGAPKGVEIRVETLLLQAEGTHSVSGTLAPKEVMLSILPLNHLFGLSSGVIYCMRAGIEHCILHALTPEAIQMCLRDRSVTQLLAVPIYVRMLMRGIRRKIVEERGVAADRMFRALLKSTKAIRMASYKSFVFGRIHTEMGGSLKQFICGGASLDPAAYEFFMAINIPVYIGYGMTETGPVIAVNTEAHHRIHSVGRALPGVEVKIDKIDPSEPTGEILTRGRSLMRGYFKAPELTRETLTDDGWFKTGDIGSIDREGFIFVRGRKKALIVLSSGKKVYPEEVESVLANEPRVRAVCVVGLNDSSNLLSEAVTAVIVPTDEEIALCEHDVAKITTKLLPALEKLATELSSYKRPVRYIFRTEMFVMTTSMKVKRDVLIAELTRSVVSEPK